jgi:hypothetical protein
MDGLRIQGSGNPATVKMLNSSPLVLLQEEGGWGWWWTIQTFCYLLKKLI